MLIFVFVHGRDQQGRVEIPCREREVADLEQTWPAAAAARRSLPAATFTQVRTPHEPPILFLIFVEPLLRWLHVARVLSSAWHNGATCCNLQ